MNYVIFDLSLTLQWRGQGNKRLVYLLSQLVAILTLTISELVLAPDVYVSEYDRAEYGTCPVHGGIRRVSDPLA